jgi:hypothetical protein
MRAETDQKIASRAGRDLDLANTYERFGNREIAELWSQVEKLETQLRHFHALLVSSIRPLHLQTFDALPNAISRLESERADLAVRLAAAEAVMAQLRIIQERPDGRHLWGIADAAGMASAMREYLDQG